MVFEAVEILVTFATDFASVGLLLFHADGSRIGDGCGGINNGKGTIGILLELLVLVTML